MGHAGVRGVWAGPGAGAGAGIGLETAAGPGAGAGAGAGTGAGAGAGAACRNSCETSVPQPPQNFCESVNSLPQFGQCIINTSKSLLFSHIIFDCISKSFNGSPYSVVS